MEDLKETKTGIMDLDKFEKEISKVRNEMMNSGGLEELRIQYETLFRALKGSQDREEHFSRKCKEIKDAIIFDKLGIETVLKQTQEDDLQKKKLREELKNMKVKIDAMKEKDMKNKKRNDALKKAINQTNNTIKSWQTLKNGIDNEYFEVINEVESLNGTIYFGWATSLLDVCLGH